MSKVLYLYLEDIKDKVILIDEPELSLHPSWQNRVLKIYENFAIKNNCQIIIATHSPHIIGSAKNEYLRFLRKDDEGKIEVVDNITAYGRDIEWILEEMGVEETRLPKITKRFEEIQELINNGEFDKADEALDKLEYVIGDNDKGILALRNDLAFERMDFEEDN
jgi:predicted ATP-binding protein involved in virulence